MIYLTLSLKNAYLSPSVNVPFQPDDSLCLLVSPCNITGLLSVMLNIGSAVVQKLNMNIMLKCTSACELITNKINSSVIVLHGNLNA